METVTMLTLLLGSGILSGDAMSGMSIEQLDPIVLEQQLSSELKTKIESAFSSYDLNSDSSYEKFLDTMHFFNDRSYTPGDLESIHSDFTFNNARKFKLRKEAWEQFADMARHFWSAFNKKKKISITSTFRSYDFQKKMNGSCHAHHCAEAGSSEHQAGLAIDLGVNGRRLDSASFEWMKNNAHKRGFHNTYQKGVEIDGKMVEPWHWRYLGVKLATELYEKKMSFAEWYYQQK